VNAGRIIFNQFANTLSYAAIPPINPSEYYRIFYNTPEIRGLPSDPWATELLNPLAL